MYKATAMKTDEGTWAITVTKGLPYGMSCHTQCDNRSDVRVTIQHALEDLLIRRLDIRDIDIDWYDN